MIILHLNGLKDILAEHCFNNRKFCEPQSIWTLAQVLNKGAHSALLSPIADLSAKQN